MSRGKLNTGRNWAVAVFMMGTVSGTGCQMVVQVDDNQVPAALIPDGAVAKDGGTDLSRADAPVDLPLEALSDAEVDALSDAAADSEQDAASDSEVDSGIDIPDPADATDATEAGAPD